MVRTLSSVVFRQPSGPPDLRLKNRNLSLDSIYYNRCALAHCARIFTVPLLEKRQSYVDTLIILSILHGTVYQVKYNS